MRKRIAILALLIIAVVVFWMRPEKRSGRNADAGSFILSAHAQTSNYGGVSITSFAANCVPIAPTAASLACGALTDNATNVTSTEAFLAPAGTASLPGYSFSGGANQAASGMFWTSGSTSIENSNGAAGWWSVGPASNGVSTRSDAAIGWNSGTTVNGGSIDTLLSRDGTGGFVALKGASNAPAAFRVYGGNGGFVEYGTAQELLTLSTSGTTTDTTGNLLPANSYIDAVDARVTTTITTATSWQLGDATTPGRFSAVNAVMTSGSTQVGTVQADQTGASGPRQVAAAKVRVTTVGTPGAGVIRIMVHYHSVTPPTS